MKKYINILLIIFLNFQLLSQEKESIKIIPSFKANEKKIYKLVKIKNNSVKQIKLESLIEISVIQQSDEGFTLKWTYKSISFSENNDYLISLINELYKNYSLEYKLDNKGNFIQFTNFNELKNSFNNLIEKLINHKKSNYSKEKTKMILDLLIHDDSALINLLSKDILIFHNNYLSDKEFIINETYSLFTQIPNIWNSQPFPGLITFDTVKNNDNSISIKINREVDKDKSYDIFTVIINNLFNDDKKILNNNQYDKYIKDIYINEQYEYKITNSTAWYNYIYCKKAIKFINRDESEEIYFLLIE